MPLACPRCQSTNRDGSRYCGRCGLTLEPGVDGTFAAGRVRDPRPTPAPAGFVPVEGAAQLCFRWESEFGGQQLSGTEGLVIDIHNVGYPLCEVAIELRGEGRDQTVVLDYSVELESIGKGVTRRVMVASYELSGPLRMLRARLKSAVFDRADEKPVEGG